MKRHREARLGGVNLTPFLPQLRVITSPGSLTERSREWLEELRQGSVVPA